MKKFAAKCNISCSFMLDLIEKVLTLQRICEDKHPFASPGLNTYNNFIN